MRWRERGVVRGRRWDGGRGIDGVPEGGELMMMGGMEEASSGRAGGSFWDGGGPGDASLTKSVGRRNNG